MRNLLIVIFILTSFVGFSQRMFTDTLDVSTIAGSDTTIFLSFKTESGSSIIFDFSNFDDTDATLSFGYSNDGVGMVTIDDSRNPFTLDTTAYAIAVNGTTYKEIGFHGLKWQYKYIAYKLTLNSVTSGNLIRKFVR